MYFLVSKLQSLPVVSLQTGEPVAWIHHPVIDIAILEVIAFQCETPQHNQTTFLLNRDVRQLAPDCIIIDNEDELTESNDLVRLRPTLEANFNPLGKPVVSDLGRKLGTVEDYAINLDTSRVQQLYVRQSLLRSWLGSSLIIDRTQIVDITPERFTVRDATLNAPAMGGKSPVPEVHP